MTVLSSALSKYAAAIIQAKPSTFSRERLLRRQMAVSGEVRSKLLHHQAASTTHGPRSGDLPHGGSGANSRDAVK